MLMPTKLVIEHSWDPWNAALFVAKLYRHAERGHLVLKANTDKEIQKLTIELLPMASPNLIFELAKYIWNRQRKRSHLAPAKITLGKNSFKITGADHNTIKIDKRVYFFLLDKSKSPQQTLQKHL